MRKLLILPAVLAAMVVSAQAQSPAPVRIAKPAAASVRVISVNLHAIQGPRDTAFRKCVGAGHAGLMLSAANQAQLAQAHRELGFEFVRFHGIFTDDMHVYDETNGIPSYDWSRLDTLYDDLLAMGIKPFVELSFMPKALASGTQEIFYWHANVTPPKDVAKWSKFVEAFARHLQQRYGSAEVASWYFEVWNEPNYPGFWPNADQAKYFELYDATAAAIKNVNPQFRVGGPATAGAGWVPEFLAHTLAARAPVDFISTHTYAVNSGFLDADGNADLVLSTAPDSISADVEKVHRQIANSASPNLPLMITEWSASYSSRDPVHDSYTSAAFVLDKLKHTEGEASAMSYWTYSDLFEENGPAPAAFHGGFGLLTRDDIPKAAYFAYKYLNELGDLELKNTDTASWLTTVAGGQQITTLLWNATLLPQSEGNKSFYRRLHPPAAAPPVLLRLAGISPGKYRMKVYRTGYRANDAYSRYIDMGLPKDLTTAQQTDLKNRTEDKPESEATLTVNASGAIEERISMRENDVVFISIIKLAVAGR